MANKNIVGKQYQGSAELHGVTVDLNVFEDTFIVPSPPAVDPTLIAIQQLQRATKALLYAHADDPAIQAVIDSDHW